MLLRFCRLRWLLGASVVIVLGGCGDNATEGRQGPQGPAGPIGPEGPAGQDGENGTDGPQGPQGPQAPTAPDSAVDPAAPLSSMVALSLRDTAGTGATNLPDYVKALTADFANGSLPAGVQFPLAAAATDSVRAIAGLHANVVVKWLDPLTFDNSIDAPRFGANSDYIAYFGDDWDLAAGAPQYAGDDTAGWVWVNNEYISNYPPTATNAPQGQQMTLARFLRYHGILGNDIGADVWDDESLITHIEEFKRQLGGSWFRIIQDPASGEWNVDRSASAQRYDATSDTRSMVTGITVSDIDHDDDGDALPAGVVAGIAGDCSGGQTPWGTIVTAEENIQDYYGDLETAWTDDQLFVTGAGFDPGGPVSFTFEASTAGQFGTSPDPNARHNRDFHGYLVEIDPGVPSSEYAGQVTPGVGHKKLGAFGRARWENTTFATGPDWQLVAGQPIVMYAGNDRRGGRIYKWVSQQPYTAGMSKAQIRALLDQGTLYVAHLAGLDNSTGQTLLATGTAPSESMPGTGRWVEISLTSTDIAPNATALGAPGTTVGAALADNSWNGIGGFASEDDVKRALFTVSNKLGVMELNRPEDVEWNPLDPSGVPRLYVAFTNHGRQVALDQDGALYDPASHPTESPTRDDPLGAIFIIEEANPGAPASSATFTFFTVWRGTEGEGRFHAANPDNLVIDADGGVWFGTDGNFRVNGKADSLYYLDLDDSHRTTPVPTYGMAFRVVAGPSDAEATGPAFSAGMGTLFFNVQHPGEFTFSSWPYQR